MSIVKFWGKESFFRNEKMNNEVVPIEMLIFVSVFIRNAWEMLGIPILEHNDRGTTQNTSFKGTNNPVWTKTGTLGAQWTLMWMPRRFLAWFLGSF